MEVLASGALVCRRAKVSGGGAVERYIAEEKGATAKI